jgi:protein-tyrosine phosphatase
LGGSDLRGELDHIAADGFGHVVSLLEQDEAAELGLADEASLCEALGIRFHHLPVRDGSIPGFAVYVAFMAALTEALKDKRGLVVHCRHGIGRTSLVVIGLLLRQGWPYADAAELASEVRDAVLPATAPQRRLLMAYAAHLPTR